MNILDNSRGFEGTRIPKVKQINEQWFVPSKQVNAQSQQKKH